MDYNPEDEENINLRGHNGTNLVYGDTDDFFACTIRSGGRAFRGRFGNEIEESHLAEVAWYSIPNVDTANPDDFILVRRQLLIKPQLNGTAGVGTAADDAAFVEFVRNNDLSVRREGTIIFANSLADLGLRGNRFAHENEPTPQASDLIPQFDPNPMSVDLVDLTNSENFMFTSMAAFDVQVYAPDASVLLIGNQIADPGEIGTDGVAFEDPRARAIGAYVDLGKLPEINPTFGVIGLYDTGTSEYDRVGDGNNGIDDDGNGAVDDAAEKISQPPVNARIRGLRFRMRTFEQINKQVRQMSVSKSFLPQ